MINDMHDTSPTAKTEASPKRSLPETRRLFPRRLRLPPYKLLRLKRVQHPTPLPSVWRLAQKTCGVLWVNRLLLLGIAGIYGLLALVFVHGLANASGVGTLRGQLSKGFGGNLSQLAGGVSSFSSVLTTADTSSTSAASAYQLILGLIASLAVIWTLRQVFAGERIRLRDAFYKGMAPLVPFVLVMCVILIQLLPFLIGGGLYNLAISYAIAVTGVQKALWGALFLVLACISVYMLCSSLFALYIVTLPDMTPIKALKSARRLVAYRRLSVFRKLLFLVVALILIGACIMVPIIMYVGIIASWVFFLLGILGLVILHTYMYVLYRELLA